MYCVKCGTKAEKGQKLCNECGMRLISPEALLKLLKKADLEKKLSQMENISPVKPDKGDDFVRSYVTRLRQDEKEAAAQKRKRVITDSVLSRKPAPEKTVVKPEEKKKKVVPSEEKRKKSAEEKNSDALRTVKKTSLKVENAQTEKVRKAPVKKGGVSENKSDKRVTPLFDNPTQPKRTSIFDEPAMEIREKKVKKTPEAEKKRTENQKTSAEGKLKAPKSNPVVKLPEKKKTMAESRKKDSNQGRVQNQLIFTMDRADERRKPDTNKQRTVVKRSPEHSGVKRPDRTKSAQARQNSSANREKPVQRKSSSGGAGAKSVRKKKDEDSFAEKHLRSIISMVLLTITVILTLMWGYSTDSGLRTMAELGLGSRRGYILLGDDCMMNGNYKRAVEHYYKALSKKINYEAGYRLSLAYQKTGETDKETSALLLLMDHYTGMDAPYKRILELYPDPGARPEKVQIAISMHEGLQ
ncbi:MAG: hypothetical protein IJB25_10120 [Clostridia bacterium]|nr:hypothetical protein [Clostridia bacterium]MBQ4620211.1 hypothetical protein [Clostridia bacterium]